MDELERLRALVSTLSAELYRVRTTQCAAAVELEKIKTLLWINRYEEVSAYDIVCKVWNMSRGY